MSRTHRFNRVVLALLIACSTVMLQAHAVAHENASFEKCALCVSNAHAPCGLCDSEHSVPFNAGPAIPAAPEITPLWLVEPRLTPPLRGPPSIS